MNPALAPHDSADRKIHGPSLRTRLLALFAGGVLAALGLAALAAAAGAQTRERLIFREGAGGLDSAALAESVIAHIEDDDVRRLVTLRGESGDVVRFGDDVLVPKGQRIRGNVIAIGGSIRVEGIVDGDAVSVGGTVRVMPGGDVRGEAVTVAAGKGDRWIGRIPGVVVPARPNVPDAPEWDVDEREHSRDKDRAGEFWGALVMLLLSAGYAWLVSKLYVDRTERAMNYLRTRPGPSFLLGLAAVVGIVPSIVGVAIVAAILCITIIGIPVAVLLLIAYLFGICLLVMWGYYVGGAVAGTYALGRVRPQDGMPTLLRALLAGTVLVWGLFLISRFFHLIGAGPVGTLISVLTWIGLSLLLFFGIGSIIGSRAGQPPALATPTVPPAPSGPFTPPVGAPGGPPPYTPVAPPPPLNPAAPPPSPYTSPSSLQNPYAPPPSWTPPQGANPPVPPTRPHDPPDPHHAP